MSRTAKGPVKGAFLNFRIPPALAAAIDAGAKLETQRLGAPICRSQYVRSLLYRAVGLNPSTSK